MGKKVYWCHQGKDKHKSDKASKKLRSGTAQVRNAGNILAVIKLSVYFHTLFFTDGAYDLHIQFMDIKQHNKPIEG